MQHVVKKYFALLLLLLFLFPQVEKGVHGWHHQDDEHCSIKNEVHFHEQEHSCAICDYIIPVTNGPAGTHFAFLLSVKIADHPCFLETNVVSNFDYQLSPRAPPLLNS